jgi:hypothetical protein
MTSPLSGPITDPRVKRLRTLARALDSAVGVPGTGLRVGLDPIIGLIPGFGDFASAAMSGYIVLSAIQLGAPRTVVMRMVGNVALDTLVGTVPLLGDLFDAGWKSNNRNVALLERHLEAPLTARKSSIALLIVVALVLVLIAAAGVTATVLLVRWLFSL